VKQSEQAMRCLGAAGWGAQRRDDGLLAVSAATPDAAARINSLLVSQGMEVFHIALAQASLEDIFLTLTGGRNEIRRAA
jgi:hypothetical protein